MDEPVNIFDILVNTSGKYPDKVFMQIKGNGLYTKYTYKQTHSMALSLGNSLSNKIKKGDKVAILSENSPEWIISYLTISYLGAVAVPLDTNIDEEKLLTLFKDSDAKIIFVSKIFEQKIIKIKHKLKSLTSLCFDNDYFKKLLKNKNYEKNKKLINRDAKLDDTASLIYTSGTTGKPKGVMLTNQNFLYQLKVGSKRVNLNDKDVFILLLPLYHIFAFTGIFLSSMYMGASITFVNSLKKNDIIDAIKETNATVLFGVPVLFESICKGIMKKIEEQPTGKKLLVKLLSTTNKASIKVFKANIGKIFFREIHDAMGKSMRLMVSGGAPISKGILIRMSSLGFPIIEGYGLTETAPVISINNMETLKFGSVGKPLEGVEVKIVDANEQDIGEITVKGPIVMKGYYKNPDLTKKAIKDGWFYTKDLGFIDEEGYLYIKGRKDDVIILSSGKNIYPEEIEQHYSKSNLIKEICVIGKKENNHETLYAKVVPDKDEIDRLAISDLNRAIKKEIEEYSNDLPLYKRIFSFDISEENSLPKTSTLKFKKFEIKNNINKTKITNQEKIKDKMDNKDFIINVLKKVSGKKDVDMDSHLELDLHLDSLAISEIISNIEEKFKIKIEYNLNLRLNKVRDMVEFVNEYLKDEGNIEKLQDLETNETGIPRRADFSNDAKEERLGWLSKIKNLELDHLKGKYADTERLKGNIEHYIGMSQVPTGISGPIKVNGQFAKGNFYVPFATTEGALVASVNRGMSIISKSGGGSVGVIEEQMTKAPMFIFKNSGEAIKFNDWIDKNYDKIKERAESTTRYGKLIRIDKYLVGRRSILRMCYSCGDALGSNMITMATQEACNFIKSNYEIEDYMLQCNLEGEKKVSFLNFLTGRGKRVYADVTIPKNIVENFLHTTPERITTLAKNSSYGSMISGTIGANAHIANILTAIFIATGQDVAHVHDSSVGITSIDLNKDDSIYFSVNLPSLAVGTMGGGTGLGTQKECLEIMGCYGSGKAKKFAEIVVACVLAGEISLSGSQAAGDFAFAHDKFGRNRPDEK